MFRLGCGGLIGSLALMYLGFQEWNLSADAHDEPEEMTLQALIKRGAEGNPYVLLTEFASAGDCVYQERRRGQRWEKVWVPLVPLEEEGRRNPNVKALLYSRNAGNGDELDALVLRDKLPGMVINKIETLGYKEQNLLKESFPQADFNTCIIFEEGRTPSRVTHVLMWVGGGVALFAVGLIMVVKSFQKS